MLNNLSAKILPALTAVGVNYRGAEASPNAYIPFASVKWFSSDLIKPFSTLTSVFSNPKSAKSGTLPID